MKQKMEFSPCIKVKPGTKDDLTEKKVSFLIYFFTKVFLFSMATFPSANNSE